MSKLLPENGSSCCDSGSGRRTNGGDQTPRQTHCGRGHSHGVHCSSSSRQGDVLRPCLVLFICCTLCRPLLHRAPLLLFHNFSTVHFVVAIGIVRCIVDGRRGGRGGFPKDLPPPPHKAIGPCFYFFGKYCWLRWGVACGFCGSKGSSSFDIRFSPWFWIY